ncbi:MAG TPA: alpha-galactosidase [Tepidisphaeraceae bacterium]|nr:alpha-galactosidase [Tepidisphaeraceae bacterium]
MIKLAMIGAGSVVFSKNLTGDVLRLPELRQATICLMDIDAERLEVAARLSRKVAQAVGADPKIEATQDRRAALSGADFVINMVQIGGLPSTEIDFDIPRKYGLHFTIADTTGPGGIFRALRTYPMLRDLCREMKEVCPKALLLNYANPMSMNMRTIALHGVRGVGLCHSVQGTINELASYLHLDPREIDFSCAGINHMAFYLKLEHRGQNLYPRLFEAMNHPEIYNRNKIRFELLKRLSYFVTESSEHNAEYSPYFIPHGQEVISRYGVPIDEYLRRCHQIGREFDEIRQVARGDGGVQFNPSQEYAAPIVQAIVRDKPIIVYGNLPNHGPGGACITGIAAGAITEGPVRVDGAGLSWQPIGELPPQLLGYIQPHLIQHELFVRAVTEERRDHVYQAVMFDPLTAATLTLDQIVSMCDELIAAHGALLPKLG